MSSRELSDLEREVLAATLQGDHPVLDALRQQVESCRVRDREWTGAGFFTHVNAPPSQPRLRGSARLSGVFAEIEGLKHGAGFVLSVEDGRVATLEGFSYEEAWPEAIRGFTVHPSAAPPDLAALAIAV
jgi:hypothetical protein